MLGISSVIAVIVIGILPSWSLEIKEVSSKETFPKAIDLYEFKEAQNLPVLAQMKWHQNKRNFESCVERAEKQTSEKSLGVWIAVTHLYCLESLYSRSTQWKVSRIVDSFKKLETHKTLLLNSPYQGHRDKLLHVFLDVAESALDVARDRFESLVDRNHDLVDYMGDRQRSRYYRLMGEFAWLRQKNELAAANFLRSYRFHKNSKVLSRLKSLKASASLKANKYIQSFAETDKESQSWSRFSTASRKGQTYKIAQYGVEFLNEFPGSRRVERVRDNINTVYKRLLYRRGQKYVAIKRDFENQLKKAQPEHILHWATEAYERGYQESSFKLASQAAQLWKETPHAAEALLIAARSAYYLVKRSEAESLLDQIVTQYSGQEASDEAHYLLGLLYFREKEFKKVIKIYDRFLQSSGSDRWELQVRYWLWRALKEEGAGRANDVAATILKSFPLTFYGLYVRMSEKGGLQSLLQTDVDSGSTPRWWTQSNQARWSRIKKLMAVGWTEEAETEIDFLSDPQTTDGFLSRAHLWMANLREDRALRDFAAVFDLDTNYISPLYLNQAFPQRYESDVVKSEEEFKIARPLIWAIMRQESAFRPRAVSPSNAYGLMQMLAPTAKETARWLKQKSFNVNRDIFNPSINIRFGSHFLSRMLRKYKNVVPLAVASYNVGPGNLDRWLSHRKDLKDWQKIGASASDDIWIDELPWAETSFYVKAVMRNYLLYKVIHEKYDQMASPPWKEARL